MSVSQWHFRGNGRSKWNTKDIPAAQKISFVKEWAALEINRFDYRHSKANCLAIGNNSTWLLVEESRSKLSFYVFFSLFCFTRQQWKKGKKKIFGFFFFLMWLSIVMCKSRESLSPKARFKGIEQCVMKCNNYTSQAVTSQELFLNVTHFPRRMEHWNQIR